MVTAEVALTCHNSRPLRATVVDTQVPRIHGNLAATHFTGGEIEAEGGEANGPRAAVEVAEPPPRAGSSLTTPPDARAARGRSV